jgi:hypothetical protein
MSIQDLWVAWTLHYAPLLPSAQSLMWARHIIWSVVMAAMGFGLVSRFPSLHRWTRHLPWGLALWAWVPGPWGASYWLGLAFQIPSLSAALIALSVLLHRFARQTSAPGTANQGQLPWATAWSLMAVLTGVLLLLDTFAVFDFSIYQWGFSPMAFALLLALALVPWVVSGKQGLKQPAVWSLLGALIVFLITRWPTGNVWDAVLDPCLWLVALAYLLRGSRRRV